MTEWNPIHTFPNKGDFLLLHKHHGVMQAHFDAGEWLHNCDGDKYTGAMFVLGDDIDEIEIEEVGADRADWGYSDAIGWLPLSLLPDAPVAAVVLESGV